ncbi:MAG: fatty acid desaturase [SAR324 cluster bacterium]|nr:fatty acid desaturase [SAR324 cluster bacterium]
MSKTYRPLSEVRKELRVRWYRSPIDHDKLRALSKRDDRQGWIQAGGHLALFIGTGTLTFFFWWQESWFYFLASLWIHGTVGSFFSGVAPHELGHGTVFRNKKLNIFFKSLFSLLSWWDPYDYSSSHTFHHRYTMYPEGDRENLPPLEPALGFKVLIRLFTVDFFSPPGRNFGKGGVFSTIFVTIKSAFGTVGSTEIPSREWLKAIHQDQPSEFLKSIQWSRLLLFFHGTLLVFSFLSGLWVLPLLLTFFPFIGNWLVYFVSVTQHCGLQDNVPDFRKCARSIVLNPVVEFLYWRMNWHTEHHMYAGVPCYKLKLLAREIASDMPEPRTLFSAWKEMRATWQRQKVDPNYQFDTPLPEMAGAAHASISDESDELVSSIGELAPQDLR